MAVVGDLVVNLSTDARKFSSGLNQAQSGMSKFGAMAASVLNPITIGFAAVAAGAVTVGVAMHTVMGNIDKLDAVAKTAAKTGLSGKFLQQLEFAADQSGISAETLTKSVGKLTINIGEAARGNKTVTDSFSKLGISLSDLKSMSPEEQFRKVTESIAKLPTAADRAAAAVKVFGKSGLDMVTLLNGGVEGLNGLLERATELGIGVDAEGLKKIEAANDAVGQMKASFGALLDQITVGLAPAFTFVATTIADMIPPVTKLFEKFNSLTEKAQFLGDLFDASFSVAFHGIGEKWDQLLGEMIQAAADNAPKLLSILDPAAAVGGLIGGQIGAQFGGPELPPGKTKLDAAQEKLTAVLDRLNNQKPFMEQGPKVPIKDDGSKLAGLFSGISDAAGPIVDGLKAKIGEKLGAAGTDLNFWANTGAAAIGIGGDKIEQAAAKPAQEMKFAGAMQKGSAEAFSTVIAAMFGGKNDPNVKATEKQTKELVKAFKAKPVNVFNMLESILT